ncbi:NF-kappa-B inhibitor-interacting Ras-like protein 2 isoform X1 [Pithys albifrons albifrons]|uniref:NF-kappa-B inhibitor-interacting Ras-like protein 2 isoform X1 n=1 Tax=Pithys albifrons albifrons TaxID=3385563 RepID=UPI003A5CBCF7
MGKSCKVVVCGQAAVGKTAILEQLLYGNHVVGSEMIETQEDIYVGSIETDRGVREQHRQQGVLQACGAAQEGDRQVQGQEGGAAAGGPRRCPALGQGREGEAVGGVRGRPAHADRALHLPGQQDDTATEQVCLPPEPQEQGQRVPGWLSLLPFPFHCHLLLLTSLLPLHTPPAELSGVTEPVGSRWQEEQSSRGWEWSLRMRGSGAGTTLLSAWPLQLLEVLQEGQDSPSAPLCSWVQAGREEQRHRIGWAARGD